MKRTIVLACLIFAAAGLSASPVTMGLVSFDGPFVNGIPTYPYGLQVNNSPTFAGMCDDYYHDGTPGDTWLANLTNLGSGDLTNLRFASNGLVAYQEVGWLLLQTQVTSPSQWPYINYAVWYIFNPTVDLSTLPLAQLWVTNAENEALNGFLGVNFNLVEIATPIDKFAPPTGDQEMLWITPEPASLILWGTGALALAAAVRRKWNS